MQKEREKISSLLHPPSPNPIFLLHILFNVGDGEVEAHPFHLFVSNCIHSLFYFVLKKYFSIHFFFCHYYQEVCNIFPLTFNDFVNRYAIYHIYLPIMILSWKFPIQDDDAMFLWLILSIFFFILWLLSISLGVFFGEGGFDSTVVF